MVTGIKNNTRLATLEWSADGILIIRFKLDQSMDMEGIGEIMRERISMCQGNAVPVLSILPSDMDAEISVNITDHGPCTGDLTLAEATVANGVAHLRMAELYYAHFPQPFPTAVFSSEEEATGWLKAHKRADL